MSSKHYGRATYKAFRSGGFVHIVASGETPNLTDQVILEELPFLIFPPMYGLFFVTQEISLPALKPFTVEKQISFPPTASSVRVQDADGDHSVAISDVGPVPSSPLSIAGGDYCVFQWIGTDSHVIAKCNAIVAAVYSRVFGPGTHEQCEQYIRGHGGS
jgi:hypothetical protein